MTHRLTPLIAIAFALCLTARSSAATLVTPPTIGPGTIAVPGDTKTVTPATWGGETPASRMFSWWACGTRVSDPGDLPQLRDDCTGLAGTTRPPFETLSFTSVNAPSGAGGWLVATDYTSFTD